MKGPLGVSQVLTRKQLSKMSYVGLTDPKLHIWA